MAPKVPVKTSNVTLEPSQSTAQKKGTSKAAEIRARNTGAAVSKGSVGSAPLPAPEGSSVRRSFVPRLSTKLSLRSMTKARGTAIHVHLTGRHRTKPRQSRVVP